MQSRILQLWRVLALVAKEANRTGWTVHLIIIVAVLTIAFPSLQAPRSSRDPVFFFPCQWLPFKFSFGKNGLAFCFAASQVICAFAWLKDIYRVFIYLNTMGRYQEEFALGNSQMRIFSSYTVSTDSSSRASCLWYHFQIRGFHRLRLTSVTEHDEVRSMRYIIIIIIY